MRTLSAILLLSALGLAQNYQGSYFSRLVHDSAGNILPGAAVRVCTAEATGTPCFPTAVIYTDSKLSATITNPTTAASNGDLSFGCVPGIYQIQVTSQSMTTTYKDVCPLAASLSVPGQFTNTQMNESLQSLLNGCSQLQVQAEPGIFDTEALSGCIVVPGSSTVYQTNALAGYTVDQSPSTYADGLYTVAKAGANGVFLWGINPVCADTSYLGTFADVTCNNEIDQGVQSTTTAGNGLMLTGIATVSNRNFAAVNVLKGFGAYSPWWVGYQCSAGATGSGACVVIGPRAPGFNQSSQTINFGSETASGSTPATQLYQDAPGNFHISTTSPGGVILSGPLLTKRLNQDTASQFAGTSSCVSGTQKITLPITYSSEPVILVFDETTKGGANLTAKSNRSFTVSCSGATDTFDWMVVGNPD